jgi:hypothetical protein
MTPVIPDPVIGESEMTAGSAVDVLLASAAVLAGGQVMTVGEALCIVAGVDPDGLDDVERRVHAVALSALSQNRWLSSAYQQTLANRDRRPGRKR